MALGGAGVGGADAGGAGVGGANVTTGYRANNFVRFDGVDDYFDQLAMSVAVAPSKEIAIGFHFKIDNPTPAANMVVFQSNGSQVRLRITTNGQIQFIANNSASSVILDMRTTQAAQFTAGAASHFFATADLTNPLNRGMWINGEDVLDSVLVYTDDAIQFENVEYGFGATQAGGSKVAGSFQELLFAREFISAGPGALIDSNGKPKDLGDGGIDVLTTPALVHLKNDFSAFHNNLGSQSNFVRNGELTDEGTSPSD